nr:uncharacterized protein LOC123285705 [Equus asinus]
MKQHCVDKCQGGHPQIWSWLSLVDGAQRLPPAALTAIGVLSTEPLRVCLICGLVRKTLVSLKWELERRQIITLFSRWKTLAAWQNCGCRCRQDRQRRRSLPHTRHRVTYQPGIQRIC